MNPESFPENSPQPPDPLAEEEIDLPPAIGTDSDRPLLDLGGASLNAPSSWETRIPSKEAPLDPAGDWDTPGESSRSDRDDSPYQDRATGEAPNQRKDDRPPSSTNWPNSIDSDQENPASPYRSRPGWGAEIGDPRLSQFEYPASSLSFPRSDSPETPGTTPLAMEDLETDRPDSDSPQWQPTEIPNPDPEPISSQKSPATAADPWDVSSSPVGNLDVGMTDDSLGFPLEAAAFSMQRSVPLLNKNRNPQDSPSPPSPSSAPVESTDSPTPLGSDRDDPQPTGASPSPGDSSRASLAAEIANLQAQKDQLLEETADLEDQLVALQEELAEAKQALSLMIREACRELRERRQALKTSIEQLEQRQEKIQEEMRQSFAGTSQELAVRVQSFKNFLVGSLQDLVTAADELKLVPETPPAPTTTAPPDPSPSTEGRTNRSPRFTEQSFGEETQEIRQLLEQYRTTPDYYGPPWQLRRTFEAIHADRATNWFFQQGGRGAVKSLSTRSQNILVASAIISILNYFYGDQLSALILANSPERLGEWRRGLQDCLGISRSDFGPNRGIALFEDPFPLAQRADRILRTGNLPLIIIDESEATVDLSILQFPLWLAFALDPSDRRTPELF